LVLLIKGGKVTVEATKSGTIEFETDVDVSVLQVAATSTGAFEITRIEKFGDKDEALNGVLHSEQLKQYGNFWLPPEPVPFRVGRKIVFYVTDISGAANTIYISLVCVF